jgi:hypothetical protein
MILFSGPHPFWFSGRGAGNKPEEEKIWEKAEKNHP